MPSRSYILLGYFPLSFLVSRLSSLLSCIHVSFFCFSLSLSLSLSLAPFFPLVSFSLSVFSRVTSTEGKRAHSSHESIPPVFLTPIFLLLSSLRSKVPFSYYRRFPLLAVEKLRADKRTAAFAEKSASNGAADVQRSRVQITEEARSVLEARRD